MLYNLCSGSQSVPCSITITGRQPGLSAGCTRVTGGIHASVNRWKEHFAALADIHRCKLMCTLSREIAADQLALYSETVCLSRDPRNCNARRENNHAEGLGVSAEQRFRTPFYRCHAQDTMGCCSTGTHASHRNICHIYFVSSPFRQLSIIQQFNTLKHLFEAVISCLQPILCSSLLEPRPRRLFYRTKVTPI